MPTTHVARLALEWWRASGKRTEPRLLELVAHFAQTNAEIDSLAYHEQSALAAVKPWEWDFLTYR